jgi:hypothetical protein
MSSVADDGCPLFCGVPSSVAIRRAADVVVQGCRTQEYGLAHRRQLDICRQAVIRLVTITSDGADCDEALLQREADSEEPLINSHVGPIERASIMWPSRITSD